SLSPTSVYTGPPPPSVGTLPLHDALPILRGDDTRVTVSPLVDIRTRLVQQSDVEVFRVRSPEPAYWRLTSLDRFDGRIWRSSGRSEEHTSELQSRENLVCRLLLEKKKNPP